LTYIRKKPILTKEIRIGFTVMQKTKEDVLREILADQGIKVQPSTFKAALSWFSETKLSCSAKEQVMMSLRKAIYDKSGRTKRGFIKIIMSHEDAIDMKSVIKYYARTKRVATKKVASIEVSLAKTLYFILFAEWKPEWKSEWPTEWRAKLNPERKAKPKPEQKVLVDSVKR
jgi:hypothetical protein